MPNHSPLYTAQDVEIIKRDILHQGVFRLVRYDLRHKLFKGDMSEVLSREVLERFSAAAILPYDPVKDEVILIEQFRPGTLGKTNHPWVIETVAGVYVKDEAPRDVAIREALEEANCKILDLYNIAEYFVSPGCSNEYLHLYCGRIDATHAGGIFGLAEEHEDIRAFSLSFEEAIELLKNGKINTSPAIISLQWLQHNREWLRDLWQTK